MELIHNFRSYCEVMTLGDSSREKCPPTCASSVDGGNELTSLVVRCFDLGLYLYNLREEVFGMR